MFGRIVFPKHKKLLGPLETNRLPVASEILYFGYYVITQSAHPHEKNVKKNRLKISNKKNSELFLK